MVETGRLSRDQYFIEIAIAASKRSTCARRAVGAVLVDVYGSIIGTGYNGVASGLPHCISHPCPGANYPSGKGLHKCEAIHAEENALIQCKDVHSIHTIYVTASPCIHCTRKLLNTSCYRIVFLEEYPHSESKLLWTYQGRIWEKLNENVS